MDILIPDETTNEMAGFQMDMTLDQQLTYQLLSGPELLRGVSPGIPVPSQGDPGACPYLDPPRSDHHSDTAVVPPLRALGR